MRKIRRLRKTVKIMSYVWICDNCGYVNYSTSGYCVNCE